MVLDVCVNFGLKQKSDSPDMGLIVTPKRLFRLFFENFSSDFPNFLSEWGFNGTLMVLDMCVNFGLKQKSDSPDMGPIVTPKRLFRPFLENFSLDFANFLSEWGFYGT